ncbi:respiratory nitrate reductase subunit gamma [Persicimonas caeni]|uniref:Respiratory nitrate reductase subunit gamma n=1 Tax=Persicimonas caeni TaxID=2292766 RepID=A0A4Y6PXP6_PERCE|nr:EB domain-containing protein [Persicimonas caeni]QDG52515.1 respiratory nitrate reductase subunit gamma [Persicimonas caeni]QED33737.1 respiratory nitrate reductase subunit gamma [Persicimonas caeni]
MVERSWGLPSWMTRKLAVVSMAIFMAACSDSGCDCEGFETAEYPAEHYDKTLTRGAQVRVTQSGFDYLEGQVPTLISQFQPGGLSFCVPRDDGNNPAICLDHTCADGSPGCQIDLAVDDAEITPVPSDTLEVAITIGDIGGQDANGNWQDELDIEYDTGWLGTIDCDVHLWEKGASQSTPGTLDATLPVMFSIDQNSPTGDVRIDLGEIQMEDITQQVDFELDGGIGCTVGNWLSGLLRGQLEDQVKSMLEDTIADLEAQQLCRACGDGEPVCPSNSTCGDNNGTQSCMYSDGTCVPASFGVEGNLMLGQVIGDFTQNPDSKVHTMFKLADMADVDTGLNLGGRIGSQPEEFARCIPVDPTTRPSFDPVDRSSSILTDSRPGGDPFMVGIGMHKRSVEHVLWSTWGSGALCMKIDSNDVSQLSANTLGALLPSIKKLAGGDAMLYLQIAPQTGPTVKLGANTVTPDGDTYAIDDPLMTLDWRDLDLHFYVFAKERFVRVFTLRADMLLPIALAADGQGSIVPVLGDLEGAVQNIRPIRTELLKEDPQRIIDLIPTLMGMALPSLAGSISQPIELPEFVGMRIALEQDDITSVDNNTMIALYADLVPAGTQPMSMMLDTSIVDTSVDLSEWTASGVPRPKAIVDVVSVLPAYANAEMSSDIEYSYRVDGGIWSMYQRTTRLEIQDPMLVLEGEHRIEVRARFRGDADSSELEPAQTFVTVDYSAPDFAIERDGELVTLDAQDAVDAPEDLMFRYRVVDGQGESQWTPWLPERTIDLAAIGAPEHFRLVAQVRDSAGHVSEDEQNVVWEPMDYDDAAPTLDTDTSEPKAGCQAAGSSSPMGAAGGLLAIFGVAMLLWRRRKSTQLFRRASILVVAIAAIGLTGCDDDAGSKDQPQTCEPACADNQECVEGTCELIEGACETDDQCSCPEGEIATCGDDGMCACEVACSEGCGDDQFCCYASNSCQDLPDPCADTVCDPGFEPKATSQGTGDSTTCEVTGAACECVSLPPLPMGVHGEYASVAQNGDVRASAVYNRTYTDLMVATVDQNGEPTWYFVDGLPDDGDVEGALDGPRGGIADTGTNVGTHTATGVDANGNIHVLYRDEENGDLKYARGTSGADGYTFELKTLDDAGDTGLWSSMVIQGGNVYAVYAAFQVEDATDGWQTQLRYIDFPADAALDALAPTPEVVYAAATDNPCGGACGGFELCFPGDTPTCSEPTDDCADSCGDGLECYNGACEPYYTRGKRAYPMMVGLYAHLSTTSDGLAVTFYDHLQQQVGWSTRANDTWAEATLLGAASGPYVSGAVDADGNVHLAYMDTQTQQLVYEIPGQNTRETIADGVRDTTEGYVLNDIGEDVELRLESDGTVRVLYQDATWHKLHIATRDASGNWTVDTLSEPGDPYSGSHGFFAAMVRNADSSDLAVDFVLNNQADPAEGKPEFHTLP